jgi:hypothetical protein
VTSFLGTVTQPNPSTLPCFVLLVVPVPAVFAGNSGDQQPKSPKGGIILECVRQSKDDTALFGSCAFFCTDPRGAITEAVVALYRIQKACPTTSTKCPISLQGTPPAGRIGPIEFGRIGIVENSCIYGQKQ